MTTGLSSEYNQTDDLGNNQIFKYLMKTLLQLDGLTTGLHLRKWSIS